mmetsp:Transcript_24694/g.78955  ORF Transcript_24694/g.78955 Transcript_24694/m.78955 type:complete len:305 (-) Transcript_24694:1898-2812(-)
MFESRQQRARPKKSSAPTSLIYLRPRPTALAKTSCRRPHKLAARLGRPPDRPVAVVAGAGDPWLGSRHRGLNLRRQVCKVRAQLARDLLQPDRHHLALRQLLAELRGRLVRPVRRRAQLANQPLVLPEGEFEQPRLELLVCHRPLHLPCRRLCLLARAVSAVDLLAARLLRRQQLLDLELGHVCLLRRRAQLLAQLVHLLAQRRLRRRSALAARGSLPLGLDVVALVHIALHVGHHHLLPPLQLRVAQLHPVDLALHRARLGRANRRVERRPRLTLKSNLLLDEARLLLRLGHVEQVLLLLLLE